MMRLLLLKQGDPGIRGPMGNPGKEGPKVDAHVLDSVKMNHSPNQQQH